MSHDVQPAIYSSPSVEAVSAALCDRMRHRLDGWSDAKVFDLLADTLFYERKRAHHDHEPPAYLALLEAGAQALLQQDRAAVELALLDLVRTYAREIHNPFSPRTYAVATRILPQALTRLMGTSRVRDLLRREDATRRIRVEGPLEQLRALAQRGTLVFAPTHVSNLDSPLLGYALYAAGLPPAAYGAGLNLFSNEVMGWFMRRLGAYTVDRRKRSELYKEVLKDYSIETIRRGCHSLFFPGGTRCRSGRLEKKLKKGLLGTGLIAWQENLAGGVGLPDVFVVPVTLSIGLVLEAETLIADALAEEGKQRYIISDDEFSQPRTVAAFLRQILSLDAAVHVRFGSPMDVVGNPIDANGVSLDPHGAPIDRAAYDRNARGKVQADPQRDHLYTERLSKRLVEAYHRDFVVQSTHLAAYAAWDALAARYPGWDVYRLVRLQGAETAVFVADVLRRMDEAHLQLTRTRHQLPTALPGDAQATLAEAVHRFASFHSVRALRREGDTLILSPELLYYYRNRLDGFGVKT